KICRFCNRRLAPHCSMAIIEPTAANTSSPFLPPTKSRFYYHMKLATWNVNSLKVRLPHVLKWLADNPVDVLCLQETKTTDDNFPVDEIAAAGYHVAFSGQKTYNGVAILSRLPMGEIVRN